RTHHAGVGARTEPAHVLPVRVPETVREEPLEGLADQLLARITEELVGLRIREFDLPVTPDNEHRVGRRVEGLPVTVLGAAVAVGVTGHREYSVQRRHPDSHL